MPALRGYLSSATGEVEAIVKTDGMVKNIDYTIKEIK
jgi:hypothetical protein